MLASTWRQESCGNELMSIATVRRIRLHETSPTASRPIREGLPNNHHPRRGHLLPLRRGGRCKRTHITRARARQEGLLGVFRRTTQRASQGQRRFLGVVWGCATGTSKGKARFLGVVWRGAEGAAEGEAGLLGFVRGCGGESGEEWDGGGEWGEYWDECDEEEGG